MTDYGERILLAIQAERDAKGIIGGKPLPREESKRVINRMVQIFIEEAAPKKKKKVSEMGDEEWIRSLEEEPALNGINIRQEIGRAQFWCKQNKRQPTRRFLVNWLNKAERIVDLKAAGATHATGLKLPPPKGPEGWEQWLETELATISEEHPAYGQLQYALMNHQWTALPQSWKDKCPKQRSA